METENQLTKRSTETNNQQMGKTNNESESKYVRTQDYHLANDLSTQL